MDPNVLKACVSRIIDDQILEMCFESHRAAKLDFLFLDDPDYTLCRDEFPGAFQEPITKKGYDIFEQDSAKFCVYSVCPKCGKEMSGTRFTDHFSKNKCFQNGRSTRNVDNIPSEVGSSEDNENSAGEGSSSDWRESTERSSNSKKRKGKRGKGKTGRGKRNQIRSQAK